MGEDRSPRISVIMPCYNVARYVGAAIESVLAQNYDNLEILVTDDGSTDDCASVIQGFGAKVEYVRQDNGGICAARNNSLRRATGDFITFLDADDLWAPDSLRPRLDYLLTHPETDLVFGTVEAFFSEDLPSEDVANSALPEMQGGRLASSVLVRSDAFFKVGYFDEGLRLGEMFDWLLRAKDAGLTEHEIDRKVLLRRVHNTNTVKQDKEINQQYMKALRQSLARRKQAGA